MKLIDERVQKLNSPDKCEIFARNCLERGRPDLAAQARERAVQLRAEAHGAETQAEKEALEAVYAYAEVLAKKMERKPEQVELGK